MVQRASQLHMRRAGQVPVGEIAFGDHTEIHEHRLQQLLDRQKRVRDE